MDTPIATPQPLPRLRVSRAPPSGRQQNHNTSVTSSQAGPSRLTDFTQLVDLNLSDMRAAHDYTDEDEEQDQYPTPRMNTPAPLANSSATPTPSLAGRLRELIHLVPNGSGAQATPTPQRPPSPTFHDSDFEGEMTTNNHSHARELVQSIFTRARREPGDTPQKSKQRRNSDGSASETGHSPKSSRGWSDTEGERKNLSDEESENSPKLGNGSSYSNYSSQRNILRSSRDTHTIEFPLKAISADDEDSDDAEEHPRRNSPPNTTSAPLQSLRISQNSSFPQHSNLLDQDSEMHRAFGEFDSVAEPSTRLHDEPGEPSERGNSTVNLSVTPGPPGKSSGTEKPWSQKPTRKSLDSHTPSSHLNHSPPTSRTTPRNQPQEERSIGINGRDMKERRTSLQGHTPPSLKHKSSASLQFSDQSSAMSISDYNERTKDMERERNHEREREWNKRHLNNARPNSGLSTHSPGPRNRSRTSSISSLEYPRPGSALSNMSIESAESLQTRKRTVSGLSERQRTRTPSFSGSSRPGSALSNHSSPVPDFPNGLRRHHSLVSRADSPASVSSTSGKDEVVVEIQQERERNWNARHPKWHRRSLPNTPDRPESPNTSKSASPHSPAHHRHERTTSTPDVLKETPNTLRSNSRLSLSRQSPLQSKIAPLSPSPAERRHGSLIPKSPNSSRLSAVVTSTPARPRSPLPKAASHTKSRLPLSSKRSYESNMETPKAVPEIQIQDETEEAQAKSTFTFPRSVNGQSLSQESMELTEAYNAHNATSAIPSFSDYSHQLLTPNNDTMHTASLLGPNSINTSVQDADEGSEDALEQERTPTLQTIDSLTEESQQHEVQESSSLMPTTSENIEPAREEPESPDFQLADGNQSSLTPSFLLTPPRSRQSFLNSSKPEFHTPPPPRGLPELPEPPSLGSDDENDDDSISQIGTNLSLADITPAGAVGGGNGIGDFTALKTPKPPGAWFATPAPSAKVAVLESDDSAGGFVDSSDIDLPKKTSHSKSIFPQTPAPPGGWAYTPVARQRAYSDPKSMLNEGGLAASAAPPGRAHTMPSKTPLGPGGWANTPGVARKSILKVRFDPDVTGQGHESSDALPDSIVTLTHKAPATKPSTDDARSTTPELVRPVTPPPSRSPRKHKRSPSVRVVDAFGNEQKNPVRKRDTPSPTPSTPRTRSGIRIVNALGEEVKEEPVPTSETIEEIPVEQSQMTQLTRVEALQRVRQGIQELAEGIESLDLISSPREDDSTRIEELDKASKEFKQSREQLAQDMHKVENELKRQIRQVVFARSRLGRYSMFFFFVGVAQVLLIFIMYRASVLRARKMFLTNYYDPFNPDLFLYTTNPDTQYTAPSLSWSLVTQALRRQDLTAFMGAVWENLSILIKKWHQQIWDVWGDDPSRPVGAWPPT